VLDQVELDEIAATRRRDRVDADPGDVRAERAAELQLRARVRRAQDVLPGPGAEEQLGHLAGQRERQRPPLDVGQVVEEDRNRMEEGAHPAPKVDQAPAATRMKSVAKPAVMPASSHQATTVGTRYLRQTSKSWI